MKHHPLFSMLTAGLMLLLAVSSAAQTAQDCAALVERAFAAMGSDCEGTGRNSACYGYGRVDATFVTDVAEGVFSEPADQAELFTLASLQTAPLNVSTGQWGVALLNVEANLPDTLPGQGVIFVLMGDTSVQNAVPADSAFTPADPVSVTTNARSNIRSGPSRQNNVVLAVESGTALSADALSPDGAWVRVVADDQLGWIFRELLDAPDTLAALPVITADTRTPMQAFYFRTGVGSPDCEQAPDALLIQGPENVTVDLVINEAQVSISSTILLRTFIGEDGQPYMEILVLDGTAVVNNLVVPTGYSAIAPVGGPGDGEQTGDGSVRLVNYTAIQGDWASCRTITPEERERLILLEALPPEILNYLVTVPVEEIGICAPPGTQPPAQTGGGSVSNVPGVSCAAFRPTSPLDGLAFGTNVFYWDAARGATRYRVLVYDEVGNLVHTFETAGAETSLAGSITQGQGLTFSWEVQALAGDQVACTSARVNILRSAPPPPQEDDPAPQLPPYICVGEDPFVCPEACRVQGYYPIYDPETCPNTAYICYCS